MALLTLLLTLPISWLSPAAHLAAPPLDKSQAPLGEPSLPSPFLSTEDIAVCCRTLPQTPILTAKANFDFLRGKSTENKHNCDSPKKQRYRLLII